MNIEADPPSKMKPTQVSRPGESAAIDALRVLRGRGKGELLVKRLLDARRADQAKDAQSEK